ncbi:hypothetical protein DEO72_LG11g2523 [Vigna unguiculata]|uniref:Uncharacterized protein n=1 Tax=Vigna unguiculata TaxID=3917 RepID=A0A4D6NRC0_VIGUN|nr:hypothetical protein DEO72_LG11g2523 [Vigna unguiculata]
MEATAAVAAAATAAAVRGASLQMPPPSRKEWRAVSDHHHSARNPDDEVLVWRVNTWHCLILGSGVMGDVRFENLVFYFVSDRENEMIRFIV